MTIWIDEQLKQETLTKEAATEQQAEQAKQRILAETLAGMTDQQIDNWIDTHVTNLAGVRQGFKIIAKLQRALIRYHKVRRDD